MTEAEVLGEVAHHNISAMLMTGSRRMDPRARSFTLPAERGDVALARTPIPSRSGAGCRGRRCDARSLRERSQDGSGSWLRDLFVTEAPGARFVEFNFDFARKVFETHGWLASILETGSEAAAPHPAGRRKP